jgi:DNA phosphorothioation-associated putative methyltransferase
MSPEDRMDSAGYREAVGAVRLGKRLPEAVYFHVSALHRLAPDVRGLVGEAQARARIDPASYNVVKLSLRTPKVSLMSYPRFLDDGFPALAASWTVDLAEGTCSRRSYGSEQNSPVLHRKEDFLASDHPDVEAFKALTAAAERFGLFDDLQGIGQRRHWEARLRRIGVEVVGNRLVETERPREPGLEEHRAEPVLRHRTALTRHSLSTPMQALWRHGFLDGPASVFDYGCGRGDDVRILIEKGISAFGWDPHFASGEVKQPADVVNLGFVLNVIEDREERRAALQGAWHLATRVLAVAVLIGGRDAYERYRLFRDGVLTQRGTFQKYFVQDEIRQYLEDELAREPVAMAPGVFFVFRDDAEEQKFLAARQRGRPPTISLPRSPRIAPPPRQPRQRRPTLFDTHRELIEDYWRVCVELGRQAEGAEYHRGDELGEKLGRPATLFRRLMKERSAELEASRLNRVADLLVYLALNLFERRRSFTSLPDNLQRDIRAFWGSYLVAQESARGLLFSAGEVATIHRACVEAADSGVGYLDGDHSLQLHTSMTCQLPAVLRVYLGCAARLYGEVEGADLVKIHIQSGKVTLTMYDDFQGQPIPNLIERVKIDLRRQDIQFFQYGADVPAQPLYLKSRYLPLDYPSRPDQAAFDAALTALGRFDFTGFGPSAEDLRRGLDESGFAIDGFQLRERTPSRLDSGR